MKANIGGSILATSAIMLAVAVPARAQTTPAPVRTTGVMLSTRLGATSYFPKGGDASTGGGYGLGLGWAFTPHFALLLSADGAAWQLEGFGSEPAESALAHVDLLGRYSFYRQGIAAVPFVEAGFSGRAFGTADEVIFQGESGKLQYGGSAFTFGGGASFYVMPALTVGLGVRMSFGEFDTVKFRGTTVTDSALATDATTARLSLGVTWYPMRGKH